MTEFHLIARKKGWRLVDIGERWGVKERQMSRIANNPTRKDLDAVEGLPDFHPKEINTKTPVKRPKQDIERKPK